MPTRSPRQKLWLEQLHSCWSLSCLTLQAPTTAALKQDSAAHPPLQSQPQHGATQSRLTFTMFFTALQTRTACAPLRSPDHVCNIKTSQTPVCCCHALLQSHDSR